MKLLLTGFEPFGKYNVNPSWEMVKAFPDAVEGGEVVKLQLPVSFKRGPKVLRQAIDDFNPDFILMFGVSGASDKIRFERVALNLMDSAMPDNDGYIPVNEPIVPSGMMAYLTPLPVRDMVKGAASDGLPVILSNSAGTYVCNRCYYEALSMGERALFIHIPPIF
ncbi:MAG: pyroglutamyl-peptidase I [Paludibacteraceae bacterium]|nr:pyroglutamyl-peptidase I [Paludibacteraceae bacterium]